MSGWLILVGIGLVVAPLLLSAEVVRLIVDLFQGGAWETLTTPGSDMYHWLWAPLIIFALVGNSAFTIAFLALLVTFLRRARVFPKLYIAVILAHIGFTVIDALLSSLVITDQPMFNPETTRAFAQLVVTAAVWCLYMRVSKRVRNTFVEPTNA